MLSIKLDLAGRVRARRREGKLSQAALAEKSGVSLGSVKRFERTGEISLSSLLRIAFVLGYEDDFRQLFARKNYQSIDEIINEQ
jgi:transcriptional regulator with XRE-family HTH domain